MASKKSDSAMALTKDDLQICLNSLSDKIENMVTKQMQALKEDMIKALSDFSKDLQTIADRVSTNEDDIVAMNQEQNTGVSN
mgnify:CR=1 FL=1